jgi:hypothetical protein
LDPLGRQPAWLLPERGQAIDIIVMEHRPYTDKLQDWIVGDSPEGDHRVFRDFRVGERVEVAGVLGCEERRCPGLGGWYRRPVE